MPFEIVRGAASAHADARIALLCGEDARGLAPGQASAEPGAPLRIRACVPVRAETEEERAAFSAACRASLALAAENACERILLPLTGEGTPALFDLALAEVRRFLDTSEATVRLAVPAGFEPAPPAGLAEYLEETETPGPDRRDAVCGSMPKRRCVRRVSRMLENAEMCLKEEIPTETAGLAASLQPVKDLDELLQVGENNFCQQLLFLIDRRGLKDAEVYKRANVDRRVFSNIRCRKNYRPTKRTALALAIALELPLAETEDLLARAEIALSPSSRFDRIVVYFITHGVYDIFEINAALFHYGQPILGE